MNQPEAPPLWMSDVARKRTDGECWYCGSKPIKTHVDHIQPRSQGGQHELANLVPVCPLCNGRKGNLTLEQWRAKLSLGHQFHFEAHELDQRPIPNPEDHGWLIVELEEETKRLLLQLAQRRKMTMKQVLEELIYQTANMDRA